MARVTITLTDGKNGKVIKKLVSRSAPDDSSYTPAQQAADRLMTFAMNIGVEDPPENRRAGTPKES